ncbi:MAG: cyclic pyranopterin phosphate synthase MoaA [Proteobacteria bacterium HN_bin10]|nr:MAG: cyclic pyranopterin phosphate synthase MoaA [Proteobacteria bacterium HN_bin10]
MTSRPLPAAPSVPDTFGRPLKSLRLSVTDRCNLRCKYCMPEEDYAWLPRETLLSFEEIYALTDLFTELGVDKVRLTGGEPLLRRDLPALIRMLRSHARITDLALTTNGILLNEQAEALRDAGLHRLTISLDTLKPERFKTLTRRDTLAQVLDGIEMALGVGFQGLKLDTVVMRGFNDDELADLIEYGRRFRAEVRFIEYMDVGGATDWSLAKVYSRDAMLETLGRRYGRIEPIVEVSSAPAQRYRLPDGLTFGIIASTTAPFCATCDRSRLTADGLWYLCLYAKDGTDLREPLRGGVSREAIKDLIRNGWAQRKDRGAEERKALEPLGLREERLIEVQRLRADPHLEMHARGG